MDLSTMRKKLNTSGYADAMEFHEDFQLMMRNCFVFNPAGTVVSRAGFELQRLFDEKWQGLPPLHEVSVEDDEDDGTRRKPSRRISCMLWIDDCVYYMHSADGESN
jgi:bromodomain-containing factor 1